MSSVLTVVLVLVCRKCMRKKNVSKINIMAKSQTHGGLNSINSIDEEVNNIKIDDQNQP